MTTLRKDAIDLVEQIPEEKLYFVVELLRGVNGLFGDDNVDKAAKQDAFRELNNLRKKVPELDYNKELAEYREERYAATNID